MGWDVENGVVRSHVGVMFSQWNANARIMQDAHVYGEFPVTAPNASLGISFVGIAGGRFKSVGAGQFSNGLDNAWLGARLSVKLADRVRFGSGATVGVPLNEWVYDDRATFTNPAFLNATVVQDLTTDVFVALTQWNSSVGDPAFSLTAHIQFPFGAHSEITAHGTGCVALGLPVEKIALALRAGVSWSTAAIPLSPWLELGLNLGSGYIGLRGATQVGIGDNLGRVSDWSLTLAIEVWPIS